ncbi:hypothetical protein JCM19233_4441 [Vibrio astriarenae]|nr:hypothetical protein JCM19233_4441 [Vibrio sp. C7]
MQMVTDGHRWSQMVTDGHTIDFQAKSDVKSGDLVTLGIMVGGDF